MEEDVQINIVGVLRKYKVIIILASVVCGLLAFAGTRLMPDQYTATVSLYVLYRDEAEDTERVVAQSNLLVSQMMITDIVRLMKSDYVKAQVAEELNIENIDEYVLEIKSYYTTRVLTLNVTGSEPKMTAKVANAIVRVVSEKTTEVMEINPIIVIDNATPPKNATGPRRKLIAVAGAVFGFIAAFVFMIIYNLLDLRMKDDYQTESIVEAPVIGHFSVIKKRSKITHEEQRHSVNSAQTSLANIRFMGVDSPIHTIVITSTIPNEGKTYIAAQIAKAAATSGKRTLIVECDMRRRSMAAELGAHARKGICSVLSEEVPLSEAVVDTGVENLHFLDAEPRIPNPSDLLNSRRYENLIKYMRTQYDFIIFDTPPVGTFVDAAVLGKKVDAVIMVVRRNHANSNEVSRAVEQLRAADVKLAGVIMNFCEHQSSDYYYEYYTKDNERIDGSKKSMRKGKKPMRITGVDDNTGNENHVNTAKSKDNNGIQDTRDIKMTSVGDSEKR